MPAHDTTSRPTGSRGLQISDLTITAGKSITSVDLLISKKRRDVLWERASNQALRATFNPSIDLSPSAQLTLRLHYHRNLVSPSSWAPHDISIDTQELLRTLPDGGNRQEWRRSFGAVEVVIRLSLSPLPNSGTAGAGSQEVDNHDWQGSALGRDTRLPSTTDEIIKICPRFRILVMGKSGVGKSSLINRAFGVKTATVSHVMAGKSEINTEILSEDNDQFVLHDSQGLEPGEVENLEIVQRFIERRSKMPDIKDKLHAIWLCFEIPRAGGRMFETGVEEFLKLKTSGKLGTIPVIAVFTKYDQLIPRVKRNMDPAAHAGLSADRLSELVKDEADAILQKDCVDPFEKVVQKRVPHMTVSVAEGYEETLSNLIKLTFDHVREHVAGEASIVSAMAQKVNPGVNIDGCIAVGKIRYWKGLASSASFPGRTLEQCLEVIHDDIVAVWSFEDTHRHLYSKKFKALMSNTVDDLGDQNVANPNRSLSVGLSMVGTIAALVSALAGPVAPIVIPIAGCFVLAKWAYDVYQQSHSTLRRLMAYIIDLTLIMQNLFWLMAIYHVPVSRRLVKFASLAYNDSEVRAQVHFEVEQYVQGANAFDRAHRDGAIGQIEDLLNRYRIDTAEMFKLKDAIRKFTIPGEEDEPWDFQTNDTGRV